MTRNAEPEAPGAASPSPQLVIGWGSELRGDDAAGRCVAARVSGWALPGVESRALHQLTPELAEAIARAARVVFVDAYPAAGPEDDVRCVPVGAAPAVAGPGLGHHGDPAGLLKLSLFLYGRQPRAWVVGVPAYSFALGAQLTPRTAQAVEGAVARVRALLLADDG